MGRRYQAGLWYFVPGKRDPRTRDEGWRPRFPCNTGLIGVFLGACHRHDGFLQKHSKMQGWTGRHHPPRRHRAGRLMGQFSVPCALRRPTSLAFEADGLIFRGLNFSVKGGQAMVVTGPNGAGKTSLLRLSAGLIALDGRRHACRRRAGSDPRGAGALSGSSGCPQAIAYRRRKSRILGEVSLGGAAWPEGACRGGSQLGGTPGRLSLRRPAAALVFCRLWRSRARCGCWMNRPRRLTRPDRRCSAR